jgi:perosamine synthetase
MDPIMDAAKTRGIPVIEDCAHAVGGRYKGRPVGALGDIACFSFGPTKNMTTGEGGMFVTSNPAWRDAAERLRRYVAVGKRQDRSPHMIGPYAPSSHYDDWHAQGSFDSDYVGPVLLGHNFRMSEFHAAIGRVQLKKLPMLNQRRRDIAARLDAGLHQIQGVQVQELAPHLEHVYHLYTFFVDDARFPGVRDRLVRWLQEEERVEVILRYFPVHLLPEFRARGHQQGECPVAERAYFTKQVQLPIHAHLEEWQIDHMIDAVSRGMDHARNGP